jgi:citrate lyase alpha subunit
MGINLKTSKIHSRARIQMLVQCCQIFGNIEAPSHKSEAGSLGFMSTKHTHGWQCLYQYYLEIIENPH